MLVGKICITIQSSVLWQKGWHKGRLYRNTVHCIVTRQETWAVLYCNIATAAATRHAGAGLGVQAGVWRARLGAGREWGERTGAAWALGGTGAGVQGAGARGRDAAGGASGRAGLQGRASCAATRQPCAATRPEGSATTRSNPPTTRLHARRHARPGRRLGVLAGSVGPSWCTVHLTQF